MSGTSKSIVSICVLLLAALVVYYGMTPPEMSEAQIVDLPKQRPSLFGGDPEEKMIALGIPMPVVELSEVQDEKPVGYAPSESTERPDILADTVEPIPTQEQIVETTYRIYTVKEGETLTEIASRELGSYKMWREIMSLNNISDPSLIMPGRVLRMPALTKSPNVIVPVTNTPVLPVGATTHIVIDGDTMSSIAGEYYNDVNLYGIISRANPTVDPDFLKIGTNLTIPSN